jgi:hypothetical protein
LKSSEIATRNLCWIKERVSDKWALYQTLVGLCYRIGFLSTVFIWKTLTFFWVMGRYIPLTDSSDSMSHQTAIYLSGWTLFKSRLVEVILQFAMIIPRRTLFFLSNYPILGTLDTILSSTGIKNGSAFLVCLFLMYCLKEYFWFLKGSKMSSQKNEAK